MKAVHRPKWWRATRKSRTMYNSHNVCYTCWSYLLLILYLGQPTKDKTSHKWNLFLLFFFHFVFLYTHQLSPANVYSSGATTPEVSTHVVNVEVHEECRCICRIKATDCNKFQDYHADQCRCTCKNIEQELNCRNNNLKVSF